MMIYRRNELSKDKQDLGFVGAIVIESYNEKDEEIGSKLLQAYRSGKLANIKGQLFNVGWYDVSDFFGTVLFALLPAEAAVTNERGKAESPPIFEVVM